MPKYSEDPRIKEWTMRSIKKNFESFGLRVGNKKAKYKAFAAYKGQSLQSMITEYLESEISRAGFVYEEEQGTDE